MEHYRGNVSDVYPIMWQTIIDRHYPAHRKVRGILLSHSASVAAMAKDLNRRCALGLDEDTVETAAMLHDIGIILTDAPGIDCHGTLPYLAHGAAGADMLRAEGVDEIYARIAERHTGAGLTSTEIEQAGLPLPPGRVYMPETILEKLICYADCFYSKGGDGKMKSRDRVLAGLRRFSPGVEQRFLELEKMFKGRPD